MIQTKSMINEFRTILVIKIIIDIFYAKQKVRYAESSI